MASFCPERNLSASRMTSEWVRAKARAFMSSTDDEFAVEDEDEDEDEDEAD